MRRQVGGWVPRVGVEGEREREREYKVFFFFANIYERNAPNKSGDTEHERGTLRIGEGVLYCIWHVHACCSEHSYLSHMRLYCTLLCIQNYYVMYYCIIYGYV